MLKKLKQFVSLAACLAWAPLAFANPLEPGWSLDTGASNLRFQSIKNTTKVESSSFAVFTGTIKPDGRAEISVALDSVDTEIDIRNVRMRFLFFETFNFPEAVITTQISDALLADLAERRRVTVELPVSLDLNGNKKTIVSEIVATLLTDDMVSVASSTPISISVAEFGLMDNLAKLQEAAGGVDIVPSATVSFDFVFTRDAERAPEATIAADTPDTAPAETIVPASLALETQGAFGRDECLGRFETMSEAGGIYFRSGSATIDDRSAGVLATLADIANRCSELAIEVGGHTDSDGAAATNLRLSERRAKSVVDFLVDRGVDPSRLVAVGYGEAEPIVPNTSSENKKRNRRIAFKVIQ